MPGVNRAPRQRGFPPRYDWVNSDITAVSIGLPVSADFPSPARFRAHFPRIKWAFAILATPTMGLGSPNHPLSEFRTALPRIAAQNALFPIRGNATMFANTRTTPRVPAAADPRVIAPCSRYGVQVWR